MDEDTKQFFSKIVSDEGLKISGQGILIKKVEELIAKQDRTNQLLSFIEKKIEAQTMAMEVRN